MSRVIFLVDDQPTTCPICSRRLDPLTDENQVDSDGDGPVYRVVCPTDGELFMQFDEEVS